MERSDAEANPEAPQSAEEKRNANEAISELRAAIKLTPDDGALHEELGDALFEQGDADGAANEFKEAIRLSCDDDARLHNSLGSALEKAGKIQEAVQEYEHAVRLEPEEGLWHWYLGDALMIQGDTDGAIKGYQRAILLGCDGAWVHERLGHALEAKGDLGAAITEYTKAAELLPREGRFRADLADALVKEGRWKDARAEYHRAEDLAFGAGPENADARVLLGDLLARSGKYEEAFAEYRKANRLAANLDAHLNLALAIWKRCRGLSASRELAEDEAGLRVDPENRELEAGRMAVSLIVAQEQYKRGLGLEELGNLQGAITQYRKALSFWRWHDESRHALCRALLRNGDPIGAFSELLQAVVKGSWGETLTQYALLLVAITIIAWSVGVPVLNRPERYLPKLAALPIAVMLFGHFYKRFLRGE